PRPAAPSATVSRQGCSSARSPSPRACPAASRSPTAAPRRCRRRRSACSAWPSPWTSAPPTGRPISSSASRLPPAPTASTCRGAAAGLLRLPAPVDSGAADGPADLIIGIGAPAGTADQHLQLLAQLSRALIRPEFLAGLRAAPEPKEVSDLVMGVLDPAPEQIPATQEAPGATTGGDTARSEEHTSELQSRFDLVFRLLLDK